MNWNEYFFRHVYLVASKSKDISSKIGAILVKDNTIISEGYNGFPRLVIDSLERLNDRDTKLSYTVHGECNAILNCARNGISTKDAILYTNAYPCDGCMKTIIQAGISTIIIHSQFQELFYARNGNWSASHTIAKQMAEEANIKIEYYDKILGIETLLGGKLVCV